jgi:hypothetical protein
MQSNETVRLGLIDCVSLPRLEINKFRPDPFSGLSQRFMRRANYNAWFDQNDDLDE